VVAYIIDGGSACSPSILRHAHSIPQSYTVVNCITSHSSHG
jgi:hypothetical protein